MEESALIMSILLGPMLDNWESSVQVFWAHADDTDPRRNRQAHESARR